MYHIQDCCEDVYIEDINGDIENLIEVPILLAEETTNKGEDNCGGTYHGLFTNLLQLRDM